MATKKLIFPLLLMVCGGAGLSCSPAVQRSDSSGHRDTTSGTVYVAGNEPFVRLELETADGIHFRIESDSTTYRALWQMQGKQVRLTGKERTTQVENIITVKEFERIQ